MQNDTGFLRLNRISLNQEFYYGPNVQVTQPINSYMNVNGIPVGGCSRNDNFIGGDDQVIDRTFQDGGHCLDTFRRIMVVKERD